MIVLTKLMVSSELINIILTSFFGILVPLHPGISIKQEE